MTELQIPPLKHDQSRWRFYRQTHHDGHSQQWILESDEYKGMAVMELHHVSRWYKDRHPEWEQEWNADVERIQANADLIQSAPIMLEALLAAQRGDYSEIENAIKHATGQVNWLGEPVQNRSIHQPHDKQHENVTGTD